LDGDGEGYNETQPLFAEYASKLGFSDNNGYNDAWDCWSTHYNYVWEDIVDYLLDEPLGVLGWTEAMWKNESKSEPWPESDSKDYKDLTYAEKTAAGVFCFTKSLWDWDELPFALDSPRAILVGKKNKKKSRNCNWASLDLSVCKWNNGVAEHCCNTCGTCDQFKCVDTVGRFLWNKRKRDNKKLYKKCGFLKGDNKVKNCKKWGMKETCPTKCDSAACVN